MDRVGQHKTFHGLLASFYQWSTTIRWEISPLILRGINVWRQISTKRQTGFLT